MLARWFCRCHRQEDLHGTQQCVGIALGRTLALLVQSFHAQMLAPSCRAELDLAHSSVRAKGRWFLISKSCQAVNASLAVTTMPSTNLALGLPRRHTSIYRHRSDTFLPDVSWRFHNNAGTASTMISRNILKDRQAQLFVYSTLVCIGSKNPPPPFSAVLRFPLDIIPSVRAIQRFQTAGCHLLSPYFFSSSNFDCAWRNCAKKKKKKVLS